MISEKATISPRAVLHEDVTIEEGAIIHDFAVIYPGTVIGKNAEIFESCVVGRPPRSSGSTARTLKETYNKTQIGKACVLSPGCIVYSGTQIGEHTLLGDHCSIREDCTVGKYCIISRNVSVNYETQIGDYTKIMDNTHITGNMKIGDHVFISVLVATTNDNGMGRDGYDRDHVYGAVIEDYVTVGAAANILPGVTVGRNAIVGASALVSRDVPPNKVVMGIPARVVRDVE